MAFEQELLALLPRLRRFARGLTQNVTDADDLCQTAIERALKSREQWQPGTRLDSWMYKITRNIWIDNRRSAARRGFHAEIDDGVMQIADDSHARMEASMELNDVDKAMAQLPDEQREAVMLVLVEGYAYKEAAEIIGCPVGTLNSRLVRGRDALLAMMEDTP